ncbi:hypothetical protein Hanom_Chr15g01373841 [Helianthus anomalus]
MRKLPAMKPGLIEKEASRERNKLAQLLPLVIIKEIEELASLLNDQKLIKVELESAKKDLQLDIVEKSNATHRLTETKEKLESSKTARVMAESLVEPLKNNMLWMQHHRIINVANSILNSIDLDQTIANLILTACHVGYVEGYAECTQHVTNALRVN